MRILLDQAVYDQRNKGNVALLQTAVYRLSELWPDAEIDVLTEAPYSLKLYCPSVNPVSVHPWQNYSSQLQKYNLLNRHLTRLLLRWLLEFREEIWHRYPNLISGGWWKKETALLDRSDLTQTGNEKKSRYSEIVSETETTEQVKNDIVQAVQDADLVVATGGGYLCDPEMKDSVQVFDTLEMAVRLGKKTAMVGQGVGPMEDSEFRLRLSSLLPQIDVILVREPKIAKPLLESLGVDPKRISVTGDDAIEMAYKARATRLGYCIGVNVRLASYTKVESIFVDRIRQTLHRSARKYQAPLMALPTSSNIVETDLEYIRKLLDGYDNVLIDWRRYDQPLDLIKKIGRCRLVITGAFHPALFALAQGIPAIGFFNSVYSYNKFSALNDEFGPACQILHLEDESFDEKLATAIDTAWTSAEELKSGLFDAALCQIERGQAGYRRIFELFEEG